MRAAGHDTTGGSTPLGLSSIRPSPASTPTTTSPVSDPSTPRPLRPPVPEFLSFSAHEQQQQPVEQVPLEHSSHRVSFMEQSSQRLPFLEQTICHVPLLEQSPYHVPPLSEQSPQRLSLSDQSPHHVPFLEQSPHHLPLLEQSTQRLAPQQHLPEHQAENTASVLPVPATGVSIQESVLSEHDSVQPQAMQELVTASCEGLVFVLQSIDHVEEVNAQQAITSLAQVSWL